MPTITIKTTSRKYDILIEKGALKNCAVNLCRQGLIGDTCEKVLIISDSNVSKLYGNAVTASFDALDKKIQLFTFTFEAGENSKNIKTYIDIIDFLAVNRFSRSDLILALGGGVCGDVSGFVSSTYLRGLRFVQLPTTLLSAIDSSIGGKNGVNTDTGKNQLGTFYQPHYVIIDTDAFDTLPKREIQCGLGEAVKYAILQGGEIFNILSNGLNKSDIDRFVELCILVKMHYVQKDEYEKNIRKYLNLGHTLGHAVELDSNYVIPHGLAVCEGILMMTNKAKRNGTMSSQEYAKIFSLLNKNGLISGKTYDLKHLCELALSDKKRAGSHLTMITVKRIGKCEMTQIEAKELYSFMKE